MAIVIGNNSRNATAGGSSISWAHTVGSGDDRLLIVGVLFNPGNPASVTVSGITYGGVALTLLDTQENTDVAASAVRAEYWYLKMPTVGTGTIVVTLTGTVSALQGVALDLANVAQATTFGTQQKTKGSDNAPTAPAVSSASGEYVVDIVGQNPDNSVIAELDPGTGQTEYAENEVVGFSSAGSYEAGAASVTMSWTSTSTATNHTWAIIAAPVKPSTDVSDPITASISELRVNPFRQVPRLSYYPESDTTAAVQHAALQFAVSGLHPTVYRARFDDADDSMILDSVWSLPSVAPAGQMALSELKTPNTDLSLVLTTQDKVIQYGLGSSLEPANLESPGIIVPDSEHACATRFSSWSDGEGPYYLYGINVRTKHFTNGEDFVGLSYCWDDWRAWTPVQWKSGDDVWFSWRGSEKAWGHILRVYLLLHDASNTEPSPAGIREVKPVLVPYTGPRQQQGVDFTRTMAQMEPQ